MSDLRKPSLGGRLEMSPSPAEEILVVKKMTSHRLGYLSEDPLLLSGLLVSYRPGSRLIHVGRGRTEIDPHHLVLGCLGFSWWRSYGNWIDGFSD